jgi:ADP-heptose:LPS heptosyltransferase
VRFLAYGDVLFLLPLIETLARSSRVSSVDVLTLRAYSSLLERTPHVGHVFGLDGPGGSEADAVADRSYDVLIDLHTRSVPLPGACERAVSRIHARERRGFLTPRGVARHDRSFETRRADEHAVEYYARAAADMFDGPLGSGLIEIDTSDLARAAATLPPDAICIAPGARYPWKRWPADRFARLVRLLRSQGFSPVLVGLPFDRDAIHAVARRCETPPVIQVHDDDYALAATMRAAGTVVANASGLSVLGAFAQARVVCIHSHTLPEMWGPWTPGHRNVVGRSRTCRCSGISDQERWAPCGLAIDPADVAEHVLDVACRRS